MDGNKKIFQELRLTSNSAVAYINSRIHNDDTRDITMLHGRIIKYLCDHEQEDVFQRDIETLLSVRLSTATTILKCMEKNGLITRSCVSSDSRLKKLHLTELARSLNEFHASQMAAAEAQARRGISEDELKNFFSILERIRQNLKTN